MTERLVKRSVFDRDFGQRTLTDDGANAIFEFGIEIVRGRPDYMIELARIKMNVMN